MTDTAVQVLKARCLAPGEDWPALVERVVDNVSSLAGDTFFKERFRAIMEPRYFVPNFPTLRNAGRELQQLSACFVIPIPDSIEGIFEAVKRAAIIHKSGGGTGFSFSDIRPATDVVSSTGGIASGPCSFLDVFDVATESVKQGGTRRGANMAVLSVHHPDILEFVEAKSLSNRRWTNFNVSVGITDAFMDALRTGQSYPLINPRTREVVGQESTVRVWKRITQCAHAVGDPGLVFLDQINRRHENSHLGQIQATNPCGEQPLLPNESCNLGSIDLHKILGDLDYSNWKSWSKPLRPIIFDAVRFLDDVIDANRYPDPDTEAAAKLTRRIGLGVMGWADLLAQWKISYNSQTAVELAQHLSTIVVELTLEASFHLATQRGIYPGSPDWHPKTGPRNTSPNTIAPTGTVSIIAGCSSGIEPIYSLAYVRHILDGQHIAEIHPLFARIGRAEGWLTPSLVHDLLHGRESSIIEELKEIFPVAGEIPPEMHLAMQAAWQGPLDNAVSKTINLPHHTTVEEVDNIYRLAHRAKLMGITVYRDASRPTQVLTPAISAELCPECFSGIVKREGCNWCPNCYYSSCNI